MWRRVKSKGCCVGEEQSASGLVWRGGLHKAAAVTSSNKTRCDEDERLTAGSGGCRTPPPPLLTFEAGTLQQVERVPQQGPVAHGQQRLGDAGRQVRHAGAAARRHQHGLELHPATAPAGRVTAGTGPAGPHRAQPGPRPPTTRREAPAAPVRCVKPRHITLSYLKLR